MSEKTAKLARMANQIADYFRAYPHDEAVKGVQEHLHAFWRQSMRRELAAHAAATDGEGLDPLVLEALRREAERAKATA